MVSKNEETPNQIALFPERDYPEMGIEGKWLSYPYAWSDLDAQVLHFYAEFLRQGNRSLLLTFTDASETVGEVE